MSTPLVAALTRLSATFADAPMIVTISKQPIAELFAHVYGEARACNLVIDEGGVIAGFARADGAAHRFDRLVGKPIEEGAPALLLAAGDALILRFVDPTSFDRLAIGCPAAFDDAAAVWLEMTDPDDQARARARLHLAGLRHAIPVPPHPGLLLAHGPLRADSPRRARGARPRTLVIVENNLGADRGHYLALTRRITAGALEAGMRVVWAASEAFSGPAPPEVMVERVFAESVFDEAHVRDGRNLTESLLAGWRRIVAAYGGDDVRYLLATADAHHIRALYRLCRERHYRGAIHLCTPYETRHMPGRLADDREVDWYLPRLLALPVHGSRLFLWAETEALAGLLSERLNRFVPCLPPPALPDAELPAAPAPDPASRFVFLGEAREDKGFLRLPAIARAILARVGEGRATIVVQLSEPFGGFTPAMAATCAELRAMPGVRAIDGPLGQADYMATLASAAAVLLPYEPNYYRARGSGILIEALSLGVAVLGSGGTMVEDYAGDGAIHLCDAPESWGAAASRVAATADIEASARRGRIFRARFSSLRYVRQLETGPCRPAAPVTG